MQTEIIIAGFGGQGVLFAGQLLAYAGMDENLEVTWIPSYGPEMRGGTANCTVIIADEEIGSPMVRYPQAVIALNQPSLDKYESQLKPGGVLVVNSSIVDRPVKRTDIKVVLVPGNEIAEALGERRMTNMVMLGALLANLPVLPLTALEKALKEHLPTRHQRLLPLNIQAIQKGAEYLGVEA
ncbi:MAG TPA: 2-oxoacid:acceptor oxidoreductase family protein [Anaerolineaceae bacterium]|nr:2-oxoacid:acceptor oxidoreductase family protein [Anaerolineaceae bacterium]